MITVWRNRPSNANRLRQGAAARTIAFFGHDSLERTIVKRVASFQAASSQVIGFMFQRRRGDCRGSEGWPNIELGLTIDRNYLYRLPRLIAGLFRVLKNASLLRRCNIIYARNIDMLFMAVLCKYLVLSRAPVVYEVLDIQRIFIGHGLINRAFRWAERRLLGLSKVLVVSSPDYISEYFVPQQGYSGPWRLLENKLSADRLPAAAIAARRNVPGPPWVIGWFGVLRCTKSLKMLCHIADRLDERVQIHIRGRPSHEDLSMVDIETATAKRRNVIYDGPYTSPDDLPAIYGAAHFAWCVDYLDAGANSDWLLPNRIYEGGVMRSLALARKDTAIGRKVERDRLGWAFPEPLENSVADFLVGLDAGNYERARSVVENLDMALFVDQTDTRDLLEYLDTQTCLEGRS